MRNPFIPSQSKVCRAADTALAFGVILFALLAIVAAVANQLAGALA